MPAHLVDDAKNHTRVIGFNVARSIQLTP